MIPTLISDCFLYKVHRNREQYLTQAERRRAMLLGSGITMAITISILLWTCYR